MNNYIIIDADKLRLRIEELEKDRQEHEKVAIGMFDSIWAAKTSQAIDLLREILSQSTPLIPEIEKAWKSGEEYGVCDWADFMGEPAPINKQEYISNLKLDI